MFNHSNLSNCCSGLNKAFHVEYFLSNFIGYAPPMFNLKKWGSNHKSHKSEYTSITWSLWPISRTVVAYQNPFTGDYCVHKSRLSASGYVNNLQPDSPDSGVSDEYEPLNLQTMSPRPSLPHVTQDKMPNGVVPVPVPVPQVFYSVIVNY